MISLLAAGCVATASEPASLAAQDAGASAGFFASPTPLWHDPQNAPHPAWNWPTLTHPATGEGVPVLWAPIPERALPEAITGLTRVGGAGARPTSGAGIAIFGSIMVVPGFGDPTKVVDISVPKSPKVLSQFDGQHRGAAIIAYPDGRLVVALATSCCIELWDITDPRAPDFAAAVRPTGGSHKLGVVPGTPIIYNANSNGQGGVIGIYDATDPTAPRLVQDFRSGYGCHHVYFWNDASQQKFRSICAGHEATVLLDTTSPLAPSVVSVVPMHHGVPGLPSASVTPVSFSHFAILSADGDTLVVGDEMGGGLGRACGAQAQAGPLSASTPTGALWFYDVADEESPLLKGWFSITAPVNTVLACTAHHGRLVPDPHGRDLLAMAWYAGGVVLVDFTDPTFPKQVAQWNTGANAWEAWYYNGYVFTGDLNRGYDVLAFT